MKFNLMQVLKSSIKIGIAISRKTRAGRYLHNQILQTSMEQIIEVSHDGLKMTFATPNSICHWRAETFSTKEPETLEWIDSIPAGSVFWDIGANVGLYSVYAAKRRNCFVWAFEPSVFNLELLARNIHLNGLTEQVCIIPLALSDSLGANQLRMTTTDWGGALSTFGKDFAWDGEDITVRQVFAFQIFGLSIDDAVQRLKVSQPDYIKIDVDGLEHFILKGGKSVLQNIKGILIEVNDDFHEQADVCRTLLSEAGLVLKEKRHSEYIETNTQGFQNTYNQIWSRL